MIVGLGTDIIENERIAAAYEKHGDRFLRRVYTEREIKYAFTHRNPIPFLAARFALKEAVIKALNLRQTVALNLKEIEVIGQTRGKKDLNFTGNMKRMAERMGIGRSLLSISHTANVSVAVVVLEK